MDTTFFIVLAVVAIVIFARTVKIVPQQVVFVTERLGRYHRSMEAGLHIVIPFFDTVRYKHSLKEIVLDIPEQNCITKDNVQVTIDGIIFFRVVDPAKASYGVANFVPAVIQLSQTTLRSEIGKIDLDRTFEERDVINHNIVVSLDKATDSWGVKVLRYELKSITPPRDVIEAMEKQMRAEREKRAQILTSEGDRDAKINRAEGLKQESIKNSEGEKQKLINEAEGKASAILAVATASSEGIRKVAASIASAGGKEAAQMRVAEDYIKEFGKLAKETTTMIIPAQAADMASMIATAMNVFNEAKK